MSSTLRPPALLRFGALLLASSASGVYAQMHHVEAPERVTRAIGVYEWTGDLAKPAAARFVPVSLFIEGRFEDAGLYLARPTPFALQPGVVYALEHAGEPQGLVDIDAARRVVTGKALADDNPAGVWYGYGKFTPETTPPTPKLHPSSHLSTIHSSTDTGKDKPAADTDTNRPHMSRRGSGSSQPSTDSSTDSKTDPKTDSKTSDSGSDTSASKPSDTSKDSGSTPTSKGSSTPDSSDDTDRPTLRRRDPSQDAARRREYGSHSKTASVTAAGPAPGDDPDRPVLGRSGPEQAETPELTGLPADMHQAVAVSDPNHHDDHPFARAWDSPQERAQALAAMQQLARPRVANYLTLNELVPSSGPIKDLTAASGTAIGAPVNPVAGANDAATPPRLQRGVPQQYKDQAKSANPTPAAAAAKPAPTSTATRRTTRATPAHATPLTLAQEEISGFTLSYGGLPTFVYTAATAATASKSAPAADQGTNPVAYVTVVGQRLASGEYQLAFASVTDSAHLDRSPRVRLIDAVDPDDSHRASLLFELRGGSSRQFALYRLTSAQAEQTFTTASLE